MIYLVSTLLILFICTYYLNARELLAPSTLFCGSLLFGSIWALINEKKWSLDLSLDTYLVISLGVFEFTLVAYIVKLVFDGSQKRISISQTNKYYSNNKHSSGWLIGVLAVQIIAIVIIIRSVKSVTNSTNLVQAIGLLNASAAPGYMGETLRLSSLANVLFRFNFASGIFFGFHFMRSLFVYKRFNFILLIAFVIGLGTTFLTGSRGYFIYGLVAFVSYYYFAVKQNNNWRESGNTKYILIALAGFTAVALTFKWSASALGRNNADNFNLFDYVSVYIGAEIKNLDIFIRSAAFPVDTGIWGKETFKNLIQPISRVLDLGIQPYKLDLPYQGVNGLTLGNVYTTFYPWLYDFGYIGVSWIVLLMAGLTQCMYSICRVVSRKGTSLSIIIYGYFSSFIVLSFFSNKFFENINVDLLYYLIFWIILKYLFGNKLYD